MKLKYVFMLIITVLMTVGIGLVSVLLIISENKALQLRLRKSQVEIVQHLSQISKEALLLNDDLLLIHYILTIKNTHPNILYAYLITSEGTVLSDMPKGKLHKLIDKDLSSKRSGLHQLREFLVFVISDKIFVNKNMSGVVYVGFDYQFFLNKLAQQKRDLQGRILLGAGISLLVGIIITLIVTNRVLAPIQRLTNGARLIGQGVLTHRIPVTSKNELGELAQEFNQMAAQLQKLDEMKNSFISSVSHELKTPLSAIKVYVELLKEDPSMFINEKKRVKTLSIMQQNIERLSVFIDDILDVARIQAGKLDLNIIKTQLGDIIYEIVSFYKPVFDKNKIRLILLNSTPPPLISVDPSKIRQVITNIIGNALKFTSPNGEVAIGYETQQSLLKVSISDTGPGIPKEHSESIFKRFKKVPTRYGPDGGKTKGTGLGLSICKGIIEAHGGKIWVESIPDKGSTFYFTVPIAT